MKDFLRKKKQRVTESLLNYGDSDSVLELLYECFIENNPYDNDQIREDFEELYQQMTGMPFWKMKWIVYPVCKLFRGHEKAGFIVEIRIDVLLAREVSE